MATMVIVPPKIAQLAILTQTLPYLAPPVAMALPLAVFPAPALASSTVETHPAWLAVLLATMETRLLVLVSRAILTTQWLVILLTRRAIRAMVQTQTTVRRAVDQTITLVVTVRVLIHVRVDTMRTHQHRHVQPVFLTQRQGR